MTLKKKLIEVALPLDAINKASAREKSIRHGHPSTLKDKLALNLDPQQVKQAENQKAAADSAVTARIPETYQ